MAWQETCRERLYISRVSAGGHGIGRGRVMLLISGRKAYIIKSGQVAAF